jgi:hypothetical protein
MTGIPPSGCATLTPGTPSTSARALCGSTDRAPRMFETAACAATRSAGSAAGKARPDLLVETDPEALDHEDEGDRRGHHHDAQHGAPAVMHQCPVQQSDHGTSPVAAPREQGVGGYYVTLLTGFRGRSR